MTDCLLALDSPPNFSSILSTHLSQSLPDFVPLAPVVALQLRTEETE